VSEAQVEGAREVRAEDTIDIPALSKWLGSHGVQGTPEIKQFSGGASNLTYLLRYPERDLILRRPPAGHKAKSAHDMRREHFIQSKLKPVFDYVPEMIAFCEDESVIGSEFYVMQRLEGTILRSHLPAGFVANNAETTKLCRDVIDVLAQLHAVDPVAAGLGELSRGAGYVRRQVEGWSDRYRKARTWNVPPFAWVMDWLAANQPDDVRSCVIHNDYRFDNVVLQAQEPHKILGVLDWEMATIGDPLMDVGGALAYWVQADDDLVFRKLRRQPTHVPGMLTRAEVVEYYCDRAGLSPENWAFYEVFGLFRLAVIAQQIYYRYHHKQTRNPAFKNYWLMVSYLDWRCKRVISRTAG